MAAAEARGVQPEEERQEVEGGGAARLVRARVRVWVWVRVRVRVWVKVWGSGPIMNARTGALSRKLRRKLAPELKTPEA